MMNSAVIDVAIGMVFVFLLVSFGATSGNELISSLLRWRSTNLAAGVRQLLGDPEGLKISKKLFDHPLIRGLHRDEKSNDDRLKPSHIPARLFATALLDLALAPAADTTDRALDTIGDVKAAIKRNEDVLGKHSASALLALAHHADADAITAGRHLERLQDDIEHWFNGAMDRCGSWYKRKTQLSSLIISLVICLLVNVDSLRIAHMLATNPVLRASLIAQAEKTGAAGLRPTSGESGEKADPRDETGAAIKRMQASLGEVTDLGIPLGWASEPSIPSPRPGPGLVWWLSKLVGIVLTALAASMGAPFWFDLLQKFLGLREPIKPPAGKPDSERD